MEMVGAGWEKQEMVLVKQEMEMGMVGAGWEKQEMVMVKQEMEMEMETIANGNVKENHGFTHSFPWKIFLLVITTSGNEFQFCYSYTGYNSQLNIWYLWKYIP